MPKKLAKAIDEQSKQEQPESQVYTPSQKEKDVVLGMFSLFRDASSGRNRAFQYFDDRTLTEYIEDSVLRFITNEDARDNIEDWQARIHAPFTRNKVLAILGKVVDAMPITEIIGRGDEDHQRAEILNTLLEYADDVDDAEEFFVYAIEEALVKGTFIGYEGITTRKRKVRTVTKHGDGDKIKVKTDTFQERRLTSHIVPLEEFYPSSVGIRKIKRCHIVSGGKKSHLHYLLRIITVMPKPVR